MKHILAMVAVLFLSSCNEQDSSRPYEKVFKYDGSIQCDSTGTELNTMAMELTNIGVDVLCSQKGHDGLARPTVCGAATGNINIYTINSSNLPDAQSVGFDSVGTLSEYRDEVCE